MGFFSDLLLGSKPDMRLPGYVSGMQDELRNSMPGIGFFGKQAKQIARQYNEDPESLATQSMNQGAVDRQAVDERYMSGANALIAHSGGGNGGQQALMNRMKGAELNRINQNEGIAAQNEAQGKYFGAMNLGQHAVDTATDAANKRYGMMSGLMSQGYDARRQGGLFNPQTWGNALSSFAGGAGAFI